MRTNPKKYNRFAEYSGGAKLQNPKDLTMPQIEPFFLETASPSVFVAGCAAEEFQVEPTSLFLERVAPHLFKNSDFEHVSPKWHNHSNRKEHGLGIPTNEIPEVAFLGRSNVGKSSLINSLMRRDLARSSKFPGRTQTFHYFALMERSSKSKSPLEASGYLIDLPGYGFAKAPAKVVSTWQKNTQNFLLDRRDFGLLCGIFLLIDARRGISQFDRVIMGWFDEAEIPYTIVVTKADLVSTAQIIILANEICMRYHSQFHSGYGGQSPVVHITSASKKTGIVELMSTIETDFASAFVEGADDEDIER